MMKKVLLVLIAVCMLSGAVAFETPTRLDTANCFGSDLDNAFNIAEWSTVDVKDGMIGVIFDSGLPWFAGAKYFGDTFLAGYAKVGVDSKDNYSNIDYYTIKSSDTSINLGALIGIADWGIRLQFEKETEKENKVMDDSCGGDKSTSEYGYTYFDTSAAGNIEADGGIIRPYFGFSYATGTDLATDSAYQVGDEDYEDNNYDKSTTLTDVRFGFEYLKDPDGNLQHLFGVGAQYDKYQLVSPKKSWYSDSAIANTEYKKISITPEYVLTFKPNSQVTFAAATIATFANTTSEYKKYLYKTTTLVVQERLGVTFKASSKLTVNGGTSVTSPTIGACKINYDGELIFKENYLTGFANSRYFGFAYQFTDDFSVDLSVNGSTTISVTYKM